MMENRARRMYRLVTAMGNQCEDRAESEDSLIKAGTGTEVGTESRTVTSRGPQHCLDSQD